MATGTVKMTESLEHCIRSRHSIREYTSQKVDPDSLKECLKLAQLSASNSHMQNWRLAIATDAARDRIVSSLRQAASEAQPKIPPLPEKFAHFRSDFGRRLYGEGGYNISRGDKEHMAEQRLRNYEFFNAPAVGVITMDQSLSPVDAMTVGLFIQTFMLALTERGMGSCLQVSVTGYPEVLAEGFGLPEDQMILCGIAIGWPADHKVNNLHLEREPLESEVRFLSE